MAILCFLYHVQVVLEKMIYVMVTVFQSPPKS